MRFLLRAFLLAAVAPVAYVYLKRHGMIAPAAGGPTLVSKRS